MSIRLWTTLSGLWAVIPHIVCPGYGPGMRQVVDNLKTLTDRLRVRRMKRNCPPANIPLQLYSLATPNGVKIP